MRVIERPYEHGAKLAKDPRESRWYAVEVSRDATDADAVRAGVFDVRDRKLVAGLLHPGKYRGAEVMTQLRRSSATELAQAWAQRQEAEEADRREKEKDWCEEARRVAGFIEQRVVEKAWQRILTLERLKVDARTRASPEFVPPAAVRPCSEDGERAGDGGAARDRHEEDR